MTYKREDLCKCFAGCYGCKGCARSDTLAALGVGRSAVIRGMSDGGRNISGRLSDLGFTSGSLVSCVGESPMGGMRAYFVRGAVIALRDEDAAVVVTSEENDDGKRKT